MKKLIIAGLAALGFRLRRRTGKDLPLRNDRKRME